MNDQRIWPRERDRVTLRTRAGLLPLVVDRAEFGEDGHLYLTAVTPDRSWGVRLEAGVFHRGWPPDAAVVTASGWARARAAFDDAGCLRRPRRRACG